MRLISLVMVLSVLTITFSTNANSSTVGGLREDCLKLMAIQKNESLASKPDYTLAAGSCIGQMVAEIRWRNSVCVMANVHKVPSMRPSGSTMIEVAAGQAAQAFLNWADDHPELWNEKMFNIEVQRSMFPNFPCQEE